MTAVSRAPAGPPENNCKGYYVDLGPNSFAGSDLKALDGLQLHLLCDELRSFLVTQVSHTGGHLASNLGVVELTVAIHRVFDTARDRLVF